MRDPLEHVSVRAAVAWGGLLGLAPLVAAAVAWTRTHDVWVTAGAGGGGAALVVLLFGVTVGRRL